MNHFRKPLLINAIIIFVLLFFAAIAGSTSNGGDFAFILGTLMLLLAPVNFIAGMVRNRDKKRDGKAFMIISGLLLLIGFSVCTAGLSGMNFH